LGVLLCLVMLHVRTLRVQQEMQQNWTNHVALVTERRALKLMQACLDYPRKEFPPSVIILLKNRLIQPSDIAAQASAIAILQRAVDNDPTVTDIDIEHATDLKYLGNRSSVHSEHGDLIFYSLGSVSSDKIVVGWSDGRVDIVKREGILEKTRGRWNLMVRPGRGSCILGEGKISNGNDGRGGWSAVGEGEGVPGRVLWAAG